MAFPVIAEVNTTAGTVATASAVVNLPAGIVSGNLLLVLHRSAVGTAAHAVSGGGWTNLFNDASDASDDRISLWYRQADGTEGATITITQTSSKFASLSWRITGHANPATQAPQFATLSVETGTTPNPGSLTPTGGAKDYLWLWMGGWEGEQTSPPAGWPTNYGGAVIGASSGTGAAITTNCRVASAARNLNAASEDPGPWTISVADEWTATVVAVHPGGALHELAGVASSVSSAVGAVVLLGALLGSAVASSSGVATLNQTHQASGAAVSTSSGTALLGLILQSGGMATASSSGVGNLVIAKVLQGSTLGQSSGAGALLQTNALAGVSVASSSGLGNLLARYALAGVSPGTSSGTAALGQIHAAAGATTGVSSGTAALGQFHAVGGSSAGTSLGAASLTVLLGLNAATSGTSSAVGSLLQTAALEGQTPGAALTIGNLSLTRALAGVTTGLSSGTADLTIISGGGTVHLLTGAALGVSSGVATLSIFQGTLHPLAGVAVGTSQLAGQLTSPWVWLDNGGRSVLMNPLTYKVVGQAVKSGLCWYAYDNDPAKHDGNTALLLGRFPFLPDAKAVIRKLVK